MGMRTTSIASQKMMKMKVTLKMSLSMIYYDSGTEIATKFQ